MRAALAAGLFALLALASSASDAHAADAAPAEEGPRANWHPHYGVELEAHGSVAAFDKFFVGMGGGVRASVPVWRHAPFARVDNEIGFGIGLDIIQYSAYRPNDPRDPKLQVVAYYVPVYLQWNIWAGSSVSIFLEPTLNWRYATYVDNCPTGIKCAEATRWIPTGSVGLRFRIVDKIAGTIRIGYPMVNLGVSWL